jgi:hypothetical protein
VYPLLCIVIGGWARGRPDGAAYIVDVEKGIAHRIDLHDPRGSHSACCQVVSETSANIFVFGGCTNDFKDLYNVISNFRVYSWNRSASLSIKQILPENYIPDHPLEATQLLPTAEKNDRKDEDASSCKQTHDTHVSSENEQLLAEVQQLRRSLSESVMEKEALTAANERLVSQVSELTEERIKSNAEKDLESQNRQLDDENKELSKQLETLKTKTKDMEDLRAERGQLLSQLQCLSDSRDVEEAEKDRVVKENEELRSRLMQSDTDIGMLKQQLQVARDKEKNDHCCQDVGLLRQQSQDLKQIQSSLRQLTAEVRTLGEDKKQAIRQMTEGYLQIRKLCKTIHSEQSSQLMVEDSQSHSLQKTRFENFGISLRLGCSTTSRVAGCGCSSVVYSVKGEFDHKAYAMKAIINLIDTTEKESEEEEIKKQLKNDYILRCRPHPNIMRILHQFAEKIPPGGLPDLPSPVSRMALFVVMKKYDCNLQCHSQQLRKNDLMSEHILCAILVQVLKAISHLVKYDILHHNLKLNNVFVEELKTGVIRIVVGDFGCSFKPPDGLAKSSCEMLQKRGGGDPAHHAPEIYGEGVCDLSKADLWATGVMGYEMATGMTGREILSHERKQSQYTADVLPCLPPQYSLIFKRLLQQLVSYSPSDRPTADEAVLLFCALLYGPTPLEGEMTVDGAEHWLEKQVMGVHARTDDELLQKYDYSAYVEYLDLFCPTEVTRLVNKFLVN